MAIRERVSLRGIHREITAVARKLRAARRGAESKHHGHLDTLSRKIADLEKTTAEICSRTYGVWPPPEPTTPRPPSPTRPKPKPQPAKSRKVGVRKAAKKKGR